ncbi:MAG: hypothetical protein RSG48_03695 [Clostridia bacterium]
MRSGFFNSNITGYDSEGAPIYDRAEEASFFAQYFSNFIGNGVFGASSSSMQIMENGGMNFKVQKSGSCFINGYMGFVENDEIYNIEASGTSLNRLDRIVARLNLTNRDINIVVKKGVESSNPIAQEIQRNADIYELSLATIAVNKNATIINQSNITDTRLDKVVCGLVTGTVESVDTSTLFNQYLSWYNITASSAESSLETLQLNFEKEFIAWFNRIKGQLSTDQAGHLQLEIDALNSKTNIKSVLVKTTSQINQNTNYIIPSKYKVGCNTLDVFYQNCKLVKNENFKEIGALNSISNIIQFIDWNVPITKSLEFVVKGEWV